MYAEESASVVAELSHDQEPHLGTFAERLEYLFDKIRPTAKDLGPSDEAGRKFSNQEIARKINALDEHEQTGITISRVYIGELRRGVATDPRTSHVIALARAFGVDPAYFIDSQVARQVQDQIDLLNELREMQVRQVALRRVLQQQGLSDDSTRLIEQVVGRCRELEGLDTDKADTE